MLDVDPEESPLPPAAKLLTNITAEWLKAQCETESVVESFAQTFPEAVDFELLLASEWKRLNNLSARWLMSHILQGKMKERWEALDGYRWEGGVGYLRRLDFYYAFRHLRMARYLQTGSLSPRPVVTAITPLVILV